MIKLDKQITIILMDYDNAGRSLADLNNWAKQVLTEAFLGATIINGAGTWLDGAKLYEDANKLYKCNYSGNLNKAQRGALLQVIKAEFTQGEQKAVSVMKGDQLFILDRADLKNNAIGKIIKEAD